MSDFTGNENNFNSLFIEPQTRLDDAAIMYADAGIAVFPVHGIVDGSCTCGGLPKCKPGKHPATPNGVYDATTDTSRIVEWWADNPNYNIGISTGAENGFWVLDYDGVEGRATLNKFRSEIPHDTPLINTGGGGIHLWFAYSDELEDIKGTVKKLPGLDVRTNGYYVVAPPSVHESGSRYEWGTISCRVPTQAPERLLKALRQRSHSGATVDFSKPIPDGSRSDTLTRIAGQLTRLGLDSDSARETLHTINKNQCQPPLEEDEVDRITLYDNAQEVEPAPALPEFNTLDIVDTIEGGIMGQAQWIEGLLYKTAVTSLYAPGGSGKTIMALWIAKRVMEEGGRVLYVDEEMGPMRMAERLQHLGTDTDMLREYFTYCDAPGLSIRAAWDWYKFLEKKKPDLVIYDPFADLLALSSLDENSSVDVTKWFKTFAQPVKEDGSAVLILDHVMKDDSGKYARGSSAKHAKVDAAWKMKVEALFNTFTEGELSITQDKDRHGQLPAKRFFKVGGNGFGSCTFEPSEVVESFRPRADGLKPSFAKVLEVLEKTPGMTRALWLKTCLGEGIPEGTFKPAFLKLREEHVVEDKLKRWWTKTGVGSTFVEDNLLFAESA